MGFAGFRVASGGWGASPPGSRPKLLGNGRIGSRAFQQAPKRTSLSEVTAFQTSKIDNFEIIISRKSISK